MRIPNVVSSAAAPLFLLPLLLLCAYLLYQPGLAGGFVFDDGGSIVNNEWVQIEEVNLATLEGAASSFHGGPMGRPVAMITFALDHVVAGLDPSQYKRTNLLIHLVNGVLVFLLTLLLLEALRRRHAPELSAMRIRWVALLVCALWLLHPLTLTSVLYVVQRMNSLATLFSLLALLAYLWGRLRLMEGRGGGWWGIAAAFGVATPLAVLSKENALLVPLFVLLMEWLLLGFHCADARRRRTLIGLLIVLVVLPGVLASLYLLTHLEMITGGYAGRTFTLWERLMTEGRVLWFYLGLIVLPSLSALGLFHDDIAISHGLLDPLTTLASLIGLALLVAAALVLRRRAAPLAFGILFFLAGHLMESTVFALEIAHEHRNYLPMFGILFALGYYLTHPGVPARLARTAAAALLVLVLAGVTWARVGQWSDPLRQWIAEAAYHPNSASVHFEVGRTYFFLLQGTEDPASRDQLAGMARHHFTRSHTLDAGYPAGLFGNLLLADEMGAAPDGAEVALLGERLRGAPISAASVNLLHQMSQCRVGGECGVELSLLRGLYDDALANPTLPARNRSMLLSESAIHALMAGDRPAALEAARLALEGDRKTPQHWLNYVNLLIQFGHLDRAEALLDEFKGTRMAGWVGARLAGQERLLAEARGR